MPINKGFRGSSSQWNVPKKDEGTRRHTSLENGILLKVVSSENKQNVKSMKSDNNNDTGIRESKKKPYK